MNDSSIIVSILSPTYNHENFIGECIRSALDQTFTHWEMLIINDGSSDNTAEIAKGFADNDKRIKVYNQQNIGIFRLSESYNFALQKAQGRYIAILEGDDLWEPDKLEKQVRILEQSPEIVLTWSPAYQVNIDQTQKVLVTPELKQSEKQYFSNSPKGSLLNVLFMRNCIPALTVLIRKNSLTSIGGFHQGYGLPLVDIPTWQMLCTQGEFYYDALPAGSWRVYPGQTTKTHLVKIFSGFHELSLNNLEKFSHDPSLTFSVSKHEIDRHFRKMKIMANSREGRYLLIKKQYKEARMRYLKAIFTRGGEYWWKIRAAVGLLLSLFHLDVEWLARLLHRPSYKS